MSDKDKRQSSRLPRGSEPARGFAGFFMGSLEDLGLAPPPEPKHLLLSNGTDVALNSEGDQFHQSGWDLVTT